MALTLTELQRMGDALITAIGSGTLGVEFESRAVICRSVAEMQAALTAFNQEIELAGGAVADGVGSAVGGVVGAGGERGGQL